MIRVVGVETVTVVVVRFAALLVAVYALSALFGLHCVLLKIAQECKGAKRMPSRPLQVPHEVCHDTIRSGASLLVGGILVVHYCLLSFKVDVKLSLIHI